MIYCLTGKILKKTLDSVVISCGGVGYAVQIPATTGEAPRPSSPQLPATNETQKDENAHESRAKPQTQPPRVTVWLPSFKYAHKAT